MTKLISSLCAAALLVATFQSCKKAAKTTQSYSMTAMVRVNSFSATGEANVTAISDSFNGISYLHIYGIHDSGHIVNVNLINYTGNTGTYDFDWGYVIQRPEGIWKGRQGQIVVTDITPIAISGTFQFTGDDSLTVSNGQFTAKRN